jgi:hypothetical protein
MVRTGAHVYVKYGWEGSTYGTLASGKSADKKFGLQDKVSTLTLTNNKVNLNKLNQNTVDKFAYGQQSGTASMSFTLSNPWIFGTVLGAPTTAGSNPYTHTYPQTAGLPKTSRTIQIELGYDGVSADIVRTLKGGLVGSIAINAAVGGLVDCSADVTYGKESAPSTSLGTAPTKPTVEFPYTFAHAELFFGGAEVLQCQDVSLNISQNAELLYGLNSHQAVDSYKRVLDLTGSFKASWINKDLLEKLLAQISQDTAGAYQETIGGGATEFRLTFEKSSTEKIVISCTGITLNDLGISGLEPVEPIFQDISYTAKTISVVATNTTSAEE